MEECTIAKIISATLVLLMSLLFGYLPVLISKKFPLLTPKDPAFNKKALQNILFSFLLNFGGGVLFANCFCHWLPEVREAIEHKNIDSVIPLTEVVTCSGFFLVSFLEELIHHFVIHPSKPVKKDLKLQTYDKKTEFELYDVRSRPQPVANNTEEEAETRLFLLEEDQRKTERVKSLLRTAFVVTSLSFHSVIAGLTLGLEKDSAGVWINFAAIAMHKFVIAFSVGVELVTSRASRAQYLVSIFIFSLAPAFGAGIGIGLSILKNENKEDIEYDLPLQLLQAIATGTVLYVIFFEIFPKAKEIGGTGFQHVISMIAGFAIFLPSLMFHSHHDDEDEGGNHTHVH